MRRSTVLSLPPQLVFPNKYYQLISGQNVTSSAVISSKDILPTVILSFKVILSF
jgi:hypothetical protein